MDLFYNPQNPIDLSIDLPGAAIYEYWQYHKCPKLFVHDQFGPKVEMPVSLYFRSEAKMPLVEKAAIKHCLGNILEIGAGAGSHALILQDLGFQVTALEISEASCEVMKERGIHNIVCGDAFLFEPPLPYQTLLLLMNGIGLCGTIKGLKNFLRKAEDFLKPGGQLLFDSSDIVYMFEDIPLPENYYGEVSCFYEYRGKTSVPLKWLYIDPKKLKEVAEPMGWRVEVLERDEEQYLFRLTQS